MSRENDAKTSFSKKKIHDEKCRRNLENGSSYFSSGKKTLKGETSDFTNISVKP